MRAGCHGGNHGGQCGVKTAESIDASSNEAEVQGFLLHGGEIEDAAGKKFLYSHVINSSEFKDYFINTTYINVFIYI